MRRRFDVRTFAYILTLVALTAAYARFTMAGEPRPARPIEAMTAAPSDRMPTASMATPTRAGRASVRNTDKAVPRFVDIDLRTDPQAVGPMRTLEAGARFAPALPAPTGTRSSGASDGTAGLSRRTDKSRGAPWTTDRLLADATHMNDAYVSLARSPVTGHLYAVFEATDLGGTDRDIHIARSTDDGVTWTEQEMPSYSQDESMPEIAIDAGGYIHVVWVRHDGYIVRTRSTQADDISSWAWIKGLFTDSVNATPSVAVTGVGDFATLFIAASYQEINYDLMSWEWTLIWMWSTDAGNTISFDALVPDGYPDHWPSVAMDGALVHLINGEGDLYGGPTNILLASDAVSGGFADVTNLTDWTGFNTGFPDVACEGDAVYAVYQHDWDDGIGTINGDIAIHLSFDAGATVAGPYEMVADDFDSIGPTITARDGVVSCLWLEAPAGGDEFDVAARQAGGGGAPEFWPEVVETVTDMNLAEPMYHHLAGVVGDGRLHAAWIDRRDTPTQGHNVYTCDRPLLANLAPTVPAGWDDALVASMIEGERAIGWLKADAPAYVSLALANLGFEDILLDPAFELRVDGVAVASWTVPGGLALGTYVTVEDHPLTLDGGPHLLELVLDPLDALPEDVELDNVVARQWAWIDGDPELRLDPPHVLHAVDAPQASTAAIMAEDPPILRRRHLPVVSADLTSVLTADTRALRPVIVVPSLRLDTSALDSRAAGVDGGLRREITLAAGRNVLSDARRELAPVLDGLIRAGSATEPRHLWLAGAFALDLDAAGVSALADDPAVGRLWLDDRPSTTFGVPAETPAVDEWHLAAVNAQTAWGMGYDGSGVLVGHIDSGAAYDHPDLAGHLWDGGAAWPNHGWDSVDEDDDPYEGDPVWGHGTHTAGLVVGDGSAGQATGTAPGAELMILRAVPGTWSDLIEAMQFGLDHGPVDLFTMSAGWDAPADDLKEACRSTAEFLLSAGIPWICAAGNGDNAGGHHAVPHDIAAPGCSPHPWYGDGGHSAVITVGAVGASDAVWSGSSLGPTVWDIAAPGYDDYPWSPGLMKPDLAAPGDLVTSLAPGGGYVTYSGTSMACPVAAGAVAVLKQASPGADPVAIARALEVTSVDLATLGRDNTTGAGRLDMSAALDEVPRLGKERVTVRNDGLLPFRLNRVMSHAAWLAPSWISGIVDPGDSTVVFLEFDPAGLPAGLYNDVVMIDSDAPGAPHALTVTLTIGDVTATDGPPPPPPSLTGAPNPFNPRTELRYEVARSGPVRLTVHDLRGALVRTLVSGERPAGPAISRWDGRDDAGRDLPTGLYLARLVTPGSPGVTAKLTLLR